MIPAEMIKGRKCDGDGAYNCHPRFFLLNQADDINFFIIIVDKVLECNIIDAMYFVPGE